MIQPEQGLEARNQGLEARNQGLKARNIAEYVSPLCKAEIGINGEYMSK